MQHVEDLVPAVGLLMSMLENTFEHKTNRSHPGRESSYANKTRDREKRNTRVSKFQASGNRTEGVA